MREAKKDESDLSMLLCVDYTQCSTSEDIYPLVYVITKYFTDKKYDAINDTLLVVDLSNFNALLMVCLIRATFAAREKLDNWEGLRDRIALLIDDPHQTMRGLYAA